MKEKKIIFEKLTVEEKERVVGGDDDPQGTPECEHSVWKPADIECGGD